jgi:photosystem II stability/assembly factor-like uncharacterized protein
LNSIKIMKKIQLIIITFCFALSYGQSSETNKNTDLYKNAPDWARLMFSETPNVFEVDELYYKYFQTHVYKKSQYTQYYKHWRRPLDIYLNNEGKIDVTKKAKLSTVISKLRNDTSLKRLAGGNWTALGPFKNPIPGGVAASGAQANVVSLARCEGTPNVMYCGTEPGEVYRTADGGNNWVNASKTLVTADSPDTVLANVGVFALAVHPVNPNIVYAGSGTQVFKTIDGGNNWVVVLNTNMLYYGYVLNPAELYISIDNPELVLVAGKEGIHRTENGGATWTNVLNYECYDIKAKPNNSNVLYTVRRNEITNTHEFLTSTNAGLTWTPQTKGWYTSTNSARSVTGARIAVSPADSNRVYAYLVGDSKPGDNNFIGIYKSTDGGVNWINTYGYDGTPLTPNTPNPTRPNLVWTSVNGGFNNISGQNSMNMAIMVSNTNADHILVGGIGMYRSTDAGQTFKCKYNYESSSGLGILPLFHVDSQDYRAFGNEYWATTDGGIFKSNDFFNTNSEFKMDGVRAVDFWGFGSGWNRDILMGGTYHNGVDAYAEGYPAGTFLNLIGGEPQSGYVSPSNESRVYSNSLGSQYLPETITGTVLDAPSNINLQVNEDPWYAESSEMEFHPSCFNYIYKGYQNKVFKSLDGGENYTAKYTASPNSRVLGIEISRRNTNTMYVVVRLPSSLGCTLVKTTDDWATSTTFNLPGTSNHKSIISLDPENDQIIWVAYPQGGDNNLIYQSIDGGATWTNKTTNILNGQTVQSIVTIGGTNGGIYAGTNLTCYYKNNNMTDWMVFNGNLPTVVNSFGLRPFYRDGKLRMATYGKGIWETQLYEQPTRPLAKIMVDKLVAGNCTATFNFDDYSILNHANATWAWTFQDGNISTSTERNPKVFFNTTGNHLVTLKVTNAAGVSSTDTLTVTTNLGLSSVSASLNQNFEANLLPQNWYQETNGNYNWTLNNTVGGFGQSAKSMFVSNWDINAKGLYADMNARVNMSTISASNAILTFDVAYAIYNDEYKDKLQVIVSRDCGTNYSILYSKAGYQLATAPPTTNYFVPIATQWRTESINLSAYIGTPDVTIKFRNINQNAQPLYIDNIKLNGTALSSDDFKFETPTVYPNPITSNGFVTVNGNDNGNIKFNLFSIDGKLIDTVFTKFNTPIPLSNYNLKEGMFLYKIISEDKILNGKLIISDRK